MLPRHKGTKKFIQVVPTLRGLQTRAGTAHCSSHRKPLFPQMFSVGRVIADPGVNGPSLQTTIVIAKARYTELLPNTMLAKEIHEDSSGKAKTMRPHSERSLRVRRPIASTREALCSGVVCYVTVYRCCAKAPLIKRKIKCKTNRSCQSCFGKTIPRYFHLSLEVTFSFH